LAEGELQFPAEGVEQGVREDVFGVALDTSEGVGDTKHGGLLAVKES
jgi:hypothetical protein